MHFDIDKFFDRLQEEGLSKQEASQAVCSEIRDAEGQRIAFLDQATENPEFYRFLSSQIDCYITCLKVLHSRIAPQGREELDAQTYDTDKAVAYHTMRLVMQLEQLEIRRRGKIHSAPKKTRSDTAA